MIVGYIDQEERVFCTECWPSKTATGSRPSQLLDDEDPQDPHANFWVVDACTACAREVKYQSAMALN
jgi:hypothetical protein